MFCCPVILLYCRVQTLSAKRPLSAIHSDSAVSTAHRVYAGHGEAALIRASCPLSGQVGNRAFDTNQLVWLALYGRAHIDFDDIRQSLFDMPCHPRLQTVPPYVSPVLTEGCISPCDHQPNRALLDYLPSPPCCLT